MPSDALYSAFLQLRDHAVQLATNYVDEETAAGLAGEAIASLVDHAMEGRNTRSGPWEYVMRHVQNGAHLMREDHWSEEPMGYLCADILPPDGFGEDLAQMFGALFDTAFEAHLTSTDRTAVRAIIACGAPPLDAEATLLELVEPLRRALFAADEHESGRSHVCKLSGRLAQIELQAHRRWTRYAITREKAAGWLA
jgi:hypothetical protein